VTSDGTVKISEILKAYPNYTKEDIMQAVIDGKEFKLKRNKANEFSISRARVSTVCLNYLASSFGSIHLFVKSLYFAFLSMMSFFCASIAE